MSYLVKESQLVFVLFVRKYTMPLCCLESKKLTYSIEEEALTTILSYNIYQKNIIPFTVVPKGLTPKPEAPIPVSNPKPHNSRFPFFLLASPSATSNNDRDVYNNNI
jgi:hypothetical protein